MKHTTLRGRLLAIAFGTLLGAGLGTVLAQVSGSGVSGISNASAITWSASQTFSKAITVSSGGSSIKGGLTIAAPTSGSAQTINGLAGAAALTVNQGDSASVSIRVQDPGVNGVGIDLDTTNSEASIRGFGTNGTFGIYTNGSKRISVANAGGVTVNAPASGDTVTLSNVAGANALTVTGNSAGTAVIRINTQATTGAQTATWTAPTNKPGAASGSVTKWIPLNVDGTTLYVPAFN